MPELPIFLFHEQFVLPFSVLDRLKLVQLQNGCKETCRCRWKWLLRFVTHILIGTHVNRCSILIYTLRLPNLQICGSKGMGGHFTEVQISTHYNPGAPVANFLSRSGEPRWETVTESPNRPSWASSVEWAKADILKPESYKSFLGGASAVVHSMGILLEADYKGVVQGREPIVSGLQRAFSSSKLGSQNPLARKEGEPLQPKERDGQLTYELMNRDSGMPSTAWILVGCLANRFPHV